MLGEADDDGLAVLADRVTTSRRWPTGRRVHRLDVVFHRLAVAVQTADWPSWCTCSMKLLRLLLGVAGEVWNTNVTSVHQVDRSFQTIVTHGGLDFIASSTSGLSSSLVRCSPVHSLHHRLRELRNRLPL